MAYPRGITRQGDLLMMLHRPGADVGDLAARVGAEFEEGFAEPQGGSTTIHSPTPPATPPAS